MRMKSSEDPGGDQLGALAETLDGVASYLEVLSRLDERHVDRAAELREIVADHLDVVAQAPQHHGRCVGLGLVPLRVQGYNCCSQSRSDEPHLSEVQYVEIRRRSQRTASAVNCGFRRGTLFVN